MRQSESRERLRLVFDFDGVIADSGEALFESLNAVAARKKRPLFQREDLTKMGTRQLIDRLGLRWWQVPYWVRLVLQELKAHSANIGLHADVLPVLTWANSASVETTILSSNGVDHIRAFLARALPEHQFSSIIGSVAVFGKDKAIKRLKNAGGRVVYIGDEVRDIVAARKAGVESIAVGWGKDSQELLQAEHPTHHVASGEDLVRILRGF